MGHLSTSRRILITGASRGIGAETARQLSAAGHRVVLAARHADTLEAVARGLGGPAEVVAMDVTDPSSVEKGIQQVLEGGPIDVLVNNAGICHQGELLRTPMETLRAELELDYWGAVHTCRAVLPSMLARGQGTIVNVSSLLGSVASPTTVNYCAAKAALEAFTHALRGELADRGIHCVVYVAPHTRTEMGERTVFDGVRSLPVAFTARELVRAIDRRRRRNAPGPIYAALLRMAAWWPAMMERRLVASTTRVLAEARAHRAEGEGVARQVA